MLPASATLILPIDTYAWHLHSSFPASSTSLYRTTVRKHLAPPSTVNPTQIYYSRIPPNLKVQIILPRFPPCLILTHSICVYHVVPHYDPYFLPLPDTTVPCIKALSIKPHLKETRRNRSIDDPRAATVSFGGFVATKTLHKKRVEDCDHGGQQ